MMEENKRAGEAPFALHFHSKGKTMKITVPSSAKSKSRPNVSSTFPAGLPGFEACRQFALLHAEGNDAPKLFMLQCLDDPTWPSPSPPPTSSASTTSSPQRRRSRRLQLGSADDASVLLIVSRGDGASPCAPT
jgi:flagellar assembly factor FliW